jgi:hypothetical protein
LLHTGCLSVLNDLSPLRMSFHPVASHWS